MPLRTVVALIAVALTACGEDSRTDNPPAAAATEQRSAEAAREAEQADALDERENRRPSTPEEARADEVEVRLEAMRRAASARDRKGLEDAQRELDRLAAAAPPRKASTSKDPYTRMLDEFEFKRAPLYVQQITATTGDHTLFVGVDRGAFCLGSPQTRLAATEAVYRPLDERLRKEGIDDFEMLVVPLTETAPERAALLAGGRGGKVVLSARGRSC